MRSWLSILLITLALCACEAPPTGPPADFSGEWGGKVEAPLSNETASIRLKLEQNGAEIMGRVRAEAIVFGDKENDFQDFSGTVRGEQATFEFSSEFLNGVMGGPESGAWEFTGTLKPQKDGTNLFEGGARVKGSSRTYAFSLFPKEWDKSWDR